MLEMLRSQLNVACWVTLTRLVLLPVAVLFANIQWQHGLLIAAGACVMAGLSDSLDGYLARRNHCTTPLGSFLDLLADKLFVSAMLIVLASQNIIPFWMPGIVILREVIISVVRLRRVAGDPTVNPDLWGKTKMVISMVAITGLLLRQYFYQGGLTGLTGIPVPIAPILDLAWWAMLLAIALTIFSGANYVAGHLGYRSLKVALRRTSESSGRR